MRVFSKTTFIKWAGTALIFVSLLAAPASAATLELRVTSGDTLLFLGDTVDFYLNINPKGETLRGFEFFLTFDPAVFTVIYQEQPDSTFWPFKVGNVFSPPVPVATQQFVTEDTIGFLDAIPGFQLDYTQQIGSSNPPLTSQGPAASFKLAVVGLPLGQSSLTTITIDQSTGTHRKTGYWAVATPTQKSNFSPTPSPLEISIAGVAINPAIPDTVLTPGDNMSIYLVDHYSSGLHPEPTAIWTMNTVLDPGGTVLAVLDTNLNADFIYIVTSSGDKGLLSLGVNVESPDAVFSDFQFVNITVDHAPTFDVPLPAFSYDEDTQLGFVTDDLFNDLDDSGANLTIWLEPDDLVHMTYNTANDSIIFYADTNWYGARQARLHVRDALGVSADSLLQFVVNPVNDAPVVDISGIGSLGDTLIIHHGEQVSRILSNYAQDVDDALNTLTWSYAFLNPTLDTANLEATLVSSVLSLEATDNSFYGDIALELTATDIEPAAGKDTLIISIRSWAPEFRDLTRIVVLSGTDEVVELDSLITDQDTDLANLTWSFQIVDYTTGVQDDSATLSYVPATQTLTINTLGGDTTYSALDLLYLAVLDDNNNWAFDTVAVGFFSSLNPILIPFPRDTVLTSAVDTLFTLDSYIIDPVDNPEDIIWTHDWVLGDSLQGVKIDPTTRSIIITTDATFFGPDTITMTARNSQNFSATQDLIVQVIPESDGPPRWNLMPAAETVYPNTDTLFDIRTMVKDDFTVDDDLVFTMTVQSDPLFNANLDTNSYLVTINSTSADSRRIWIYFTALDLAGFTATSDTLWVDVRDSYSPKWDDMPTYRFDRFSFATDTLNKYLSDKDSPFSNLTVQITRQTGDISVAYDTATSIFIITSTATMPLETDLIFYAADDVGNSAIQNVHVIVDVIILTDPPDGEIVYYFNPVNDRRLFYSVVADSTVNRMNVSYLFNNQFREIDFFQEDSLPGTQRWTAPEEFRVGGVYRLSVDMISETRPELELRLTLNVSLAKSTGDRLVSLDKRLIATYAAGAVSGSGLVLLGEHKIPENLQAQIDDLRKGNEPGVEPSLLYALDANLAEPVTLDLAYKTDHADAYYAFYEVVDHQLQPIETFVDRDGTFTAKAVTGRDILFAAAKTAAGDAPLPNGYLLAAPNPFNATIIMTIALKRADMGRLTIYDLLGRQIYATGKRELTAGTNSFRWHAINNHGITVPSGIYFIRLETDSGLTALKKVTLLK